MSRLLTYGVMQQKRKMSLSFEAYVAPIGFDPDAQPVNIYSVFSAYYNTNNDAKYIYSFTSDIATLTLTADTGVSYRWGETISGVDYVYDVTSGTAFTVGSTKRYVIVNGVAIEYPIGAVWIYCGVITSLGSRLDQANTYLNYIHYSNNNNTFTFCRTRNCLNLTGILTLPTYITELAGYQFQNCSKITGDLIIPDSVTSLAGRSVFFGCTGFNGAIIIGSGVTVIPIDFCNGCTNATSLTFSGNITEIGNNAFYNCYSLTGTLTIPATVITIGLTPFFNNNFTDIISNSSGFDVTDYVLYDITEVGQIKAIYSARGQSGTLSFRSDTTIILTACSYNNTTKTGNLIIPDTVVTIKSAAFQSCTGLTGNLVLETSSSALTTIEAAAFSDCRFTGTLTIPASVTSIQAQVFQNNAFTSIVSDSTSFAEYDYVLYDLSVFGKIKASYGLKTRSNTLTLRADITDVMDFCFYNNARTGSLTLPSTLTIIGSRGFQYAGFGGGSLIINTVSLTSVGIFGLTNNFFALELCTSYSGAYLTFNNTNNYSAVSLNQSIINITSGTKKLTIGAANKARLLTAYPNAETDANARGITIV